MNASSPRAPGPTGRAVTRRNRIGGWRRDPAVWAWIGVAALALLPLGSALAHLAR